MTSSRATWTDPRPLSTDDLRACLELADGREWPCEDTKWEFLLRVGQGYGIADEAGGLAASAILTRFGGLAAISMVLVAAPHGGRGVGTRLMRHLIDQAGDDIVTLYATSTGRPLYEKLGFRALSRTKTLVGDYTGESSNASRMATVNDLPAILALDTEVVGADRTHVVGRLLDFATRVRLLERDGHLTGYAGVWRAGTALDIDIVGPVIAASEDDALALIADLAAEATVPVRLDIDIARPAMLDWAERHGLSTRFTCSTMALGDRDLPGDRDRLFLPFMQALG